MHSNATGESKTLSTCFTNMFQGCVKILVGAMSAGGNEPLGAMHALNYRIISPGIIDRIIHVYISAYFGPSSVPVTIPSSSMQPRNSVGSLSQSPSSPLGSSLSQSAFAPNLPNRNKQDQQIEQVRNVCVYSIIPPLKLTLHPCVVPVIFLICITKAKSEKFMKLTEVRNPEHDVIFFGKVLSRVFWKIQKLTFSTKRYHPPDFHNKPLTQLSVQSINLKLVKLKEQQLAASPINSAAATIFFVHTSSETIFLVI